MRGLIFSRSVNELMTANVKSGEINKIRISSGHHWDIRARKL
jgi:hypothetical protein